MPRSTALSSLVDYVPPALFRRSATCGVAPRGRPVEDLMNAPESPSWGFLQWAVGGLASIGASAAAFVWRVMTRLQNLEIGNTNAISTYRSRPMNLRYCVWLSV